MKYLVLQGEWPSGLRLCHRIGRFLFQSPLGTWLGLGTQLCYKAAGDLQVEIVKMQ